MAVSRSVSATSPQATSSVQAAASAEAADTTAVSSRTVGLAELFSIAAAQSSADDGTIQRLAAAGGPSATAVPSIETTVQTALPSDSTAAAPASPTTEVAPTTATPEQLEEMARRLYEPMASRIRAELWQDRERAGLLTDLRP